jgi:coenzyme F420-reducing hydrogenase delta subunit
MGVNAPARKVLQDVGIREERYSLLWTFAAEGTGLVRLITKFAA